MRFLTCEPNLEKNNSNEVTPYLDEADKFYLDYDDWFGKNMETVEKTTRLVIYEALFFKISNSSKLISLSERFPHCETFYHSPIKQSERIGNRILLCSSVEIRNNQPTKIEL
jgi:hypothetical protein